MVVLLVAGLAVADVVTYTSVRSYLIGRVDEQLDVAQHQAYRYLMFESHPGHTATDGGIDYRISPDVYVQVLGRHGGVLLSRPSGSNQAPDPAPLLPRSIRVAASPRVHTFGSRHGTYHTESDAFELSGPGRPTYRAVAVAVPQGTLLTAISLRPTEDTLDSLVRVEFLASMAVVLALCIVALWTVRRGLRPLEDMARTAQAIAGGDLSRRVPTTDERSEVGRLGTALNTMLKEIEVAFAEQSTSEARLRQFVADASHELRTPLTSIRGYAELLRKGAFVDEESQSRALARVENEAVRMGGIVDDLLLLAQLDQGRPLARSPVDLGRVSVEAVEDARTVDPGRTIELDVPSPVVVDGDRDRLRQVAHNLVRNALAHTEPGTPVSVTVGRRGSMGVLTVVDQGPGLSPEEQARVFDRFYRVDQARSGGGTGLGLAIVQAIAAALDGRAGVTSRPGEGATFTVEIPLLGLGAAPPEPAPEPVADTGRLRPPEPSRLPG